MQIVLTHIFFNAGGYSGGRNQYYQIAAKIDRSGSPLSLTAVASQTTICAGNEITLTGAGADAYSWDNGATEPIAVNGISSLPTLPAHAHLSNLEIA